jgi:hypothetical protein
MYASPWLLARGVRNHAHSSLRALYIVARFPAHSSFFLIRPIALDSASFGISAFASRLRSRLVSSRLRSRLVSSRLRSRLVSSPLSSRLVSALLWSRLVSSRLASSRLAPCPLGSRLRSSLLCTHHRSGQLRQLATSLWTQACDTSLCSFAGFGIFIPVRIC